MCVFNCPEETIFYSLAIQYLCFSRVLSNELIIECGTGSGLSLVLAIRALRPKIKLKSYEVNFQAFQQACKNITKTKLNGICEIINGSFAHFFVSL